MHCAPQITVTIKSIFRSEDQRLLKVYNILENVLTMHDLYVFDAFTQMVNYVFDAFTQMVNQVYQIK